MSAGQFDVFVNADPQSADSHPCLIVLQHNALDHLNTRIVAPLIAPKKLPLFERLMPEVAIKGARYVIDMTNIAAIPTQLLEQAVANMGAEHYHIVRAIDFVFTGV
jgi:toxin CcdB